MNTFPTLLYKGYSAVIQRNESANLFYGEVAGTRDVVTFQGSSLDGIKQAFEDSVDDYLGFKKEDRAKHRSRKFTVTSPHPLSLGKHFSVPWADVYLSFTSKPGRQKSYLAPSLTSRFDLKRELELAEECQAEHPELDYSDEIAFWKKLLAELDTSSFAVRTIPGSNIPTIFTKSDSIDRRHAEEMLRFYLHGLGFWKVRFKWRCQRVSDVVVPITV